MKYVLSFLLVITTGALFAQKATVKGIVKDALSSEEIIGAKVQFSPTLRVLSDDEGNFTLNDVPYGKYQVEVTGFDYDTLILEVNVNQALVKIDFKLGTGTELEEVKVISNIAIDRTTPVAVTRITATQIAEELGSRDLPMILNATPGVYATQTGGGDGDARITVRGFDQRNVGVMIDGVPVNDMENGSVYWSNWFGLDAITNQIQVQRGLGATKLSMPSVGGSLNIITNGIQGKKGFSFKQEYATGNFKRSSLTYNSGLTKSGWGVTFSGSYKKGDGWVDGTNTEGWFYYGKIQRKLKHHLWSFSAFGAPQRHGQRSFNQRIQYWDSNIARQLGATIDSTQIMDRGVRFNQHYGYMTKGEDSVLMNERTNFYHKPQLTLKDFWTVNSKLSISNLAYMSIGRGGGTRLANSSAIMYTKDGLIDWDGIVKNNQVNSLFGGPNTDLAYSPTALKSSQVLLSSMNNHFWVGYLGQFNYDLNSKWTLSGGLDYRYYKGSHFQRIEDLLGGSYYVSTSNQNDVNPMKVVGDKIALNNFNSDRDGLVQWGGVFGTAEYSDGRWSAFLNASAVINAYKGVDYFQKKMVDLGDTVLRLGAEDVITYKGVTYTNASPEAEYYHTDWKRVPGATVKTGASYKLTESMGVFFNAGYLSRTPQFSNVIDNNTNSFFAEIKNEIIQAVELGYNYADSKFGVNVNGYFTNWKNKPFPFGVQIPDPNDPTASIYINVNGMDAIHYGGEVDMAYNITKRLSTEAMFSIGDWTWNSTESIYIQEFNFNFDFDAKGVHVGDAAQTMANLSLRYEPFKRFYVKLQYQWFDRYYSNFSPFSLQGTNGGRESWKIPAYGLLNGFIGYSHKFDKFSMFVNGTLTNILNSKYIADATNNFYGQGFDATSASVMFGQGFRFNTSIGIQF